MQWMRVIRAVVLLAGVIVCGGCASTGGAGMTTLKVVATPVTVVRDVVDVPLVTLTNVFGYFADETRIATAPTAGIGWTWGGGFGLNLGYDISHILFRTLSWTIGGVDYVVCRSIWPNFARGVRPWLKERQPWGTLYFPNTRVLWGDDGPLWDDGMGKPQPPFERPAADPPGE
jgi:hypothetical protein